MSDREPVESRSQPEAGADAEAVDTAGAEAVVCAAAGPLLPGPAEAVVSGAVPVVSGAEPGVSDAVPGVSVDAGPVVSGAAESGAA